MLLRSPHQPARRHLNCHEQTVTPRPQALSARTVRAAPSPAPVRYRASQPGLAGRAGVIRLGVKAGPRDQVQDPVVLCNVMSLYQPTIHGLADREKGERAGQYSIRINDQWRICFTWREGGPADVEIVDYH